MHSFSQAFAALGHSTRLAIFRLLARRAPEDVPQTEIEVAMGLSQSACSLHLAALRRAGLIVRSQDGERTAYGFNQASAGSLIDYLANDCCRGRPQVMAPLSAAALGRHTPQQRSTEASRILNVLFLCTENSARSLFAEAILTRYGAGRFRAFSAGVRPGQVPNPYALAHLSALGHHTGGLRPKHVSTMQGADAPRFDFVFSVCDHAANEECPPWPGLPIASHWGIPDPAAVTGSSYQKGVAFAECYEALERRIAVFAALPFALLDAAAAQGLVDRIGASERLAS